MTTFHDSSGREWNVRFTGPLLAGLREKHAINLADLTGAGYLTIERDSAQLAIAVAFLVSGQLTAAGVTDDQLAERLVGESLDGALEAVWGATKVFFPPKRLSELQTNFAKLKAGTEDALLMNALLDQLPPAVGEKLLSETIRQHLPTALARSVASPSATGPAASQSSAATSSPGTAG